MRLPVTKEKLLKDFESLLPWDKSEFLEELFRKYEVTPYDLKTVTHCFSTEEVLNCLRMEDIIDYVLNNADDFEIDEAFGDIIRDRDEEIRKDNDSL